MNDIGLNFSIPKLKRADKDLLILASLSSRDATEVLEVVTRSYLKRDYLGPWSLTAVEMVNNKDLEQKYRDKRLAMKEDGRHLKELSEHFAFLACKTSSMVPSIAAHGLRVTGHSETFLGTNDSGVAICKHADIQLRTAESFSMNIGTIKMVVFKVIMGRCKSVNWSHQCYDLEPSPNFDCHINSLSPQINEPIFMQVCKSMIYCYEYTDEALPSDHPRQCLPYAVLTYERPLLNSAIPGIISDRAQSKQQLPRTPEITKKQPQLASPGGAEKVERPIHDAAVSGIHSGRVQASVLMASIQQQLDKQNSNRHNVPCLMGLPLDHATNNQRSTGSNDNAAISFERSVSCPDPWLKSSLPMSVSPQKVSAGNQDPRNLLRAQSMIDPRLTKKLESISGPCSALSSLPAAPTFYSTDNVDPSQQQPVVDSRKTELQELYKKYKIKKKGTTVPNTNSQYSSQPVVKPVISKTSSIIFYSSTAALPVYHPSAVMGVPVQDKPVYHPDTSYANYPDSPTTVAFGNRRFQKSSQSHLDGVELKSNTQPMKDTRGVSAGTLEKSVNSVSTPESQSITRTLKQAQPVATISSPLQTSVNVKSLTQAAAVNTAPSPIKSPAPVTPKRPSLSVRHSPGSVTTSPIKTALPTTPSSSPQQSQKAIISSAVEGIGKYLSQINDDLMSKVKDAMTVYSDMSTSDTSAAETSADEDGRIASSLYKSHAAAALQRSPGQPLLGARQDRGSDISVSENKTGAKVDSRSSSPPETQSSSTPRGMRFSTRKHNISKAATSNITRDSNVRNTFDEVESSGITYTSLVSECRTDAGSASQNTMDNSDGTFKSEPPSDDSETPTKDQRINVASRNPVHRNTNMSGYVKRRRRSRRQLVSSSNSCADQSSDEPALVSEQERMAMDCEREIQALVFEVQRLQSQMSSSPKPDASTDVNVGNNESQNCSQASVDPLTGNRAGVLSACTTSDTEQGEIPTESQISLSSKIMSVLKLPSNTNLTAKSEPDTNLKPCVSGDVEDDIWLDAFSSSNVLLDSTEPLVDNVLAEQKNDTYYPIGDDCDMDICDNSLEQETIKKEKSLENSAVKEKSHTHASRTRETEHSTKTSSASVRGRLSMHINEVRDAIIIRMSDINADAIPLTADNSKIDDPPSNQMLETKSERRSNEDDAENSHMSDSDIDGVPLSPGDLIRTNQERKTKNVNMPADIKLSQIPLPVGNSNAKDVQLANKNQPQSVLGSFQKLCIHDAHISVNDNKADQLKTSDVKVNSNNFKDHHHPQIPINESSECISTDKQSDLQHKRSPESLVTGIVTRALSFDSETSIKSPVRVKNTNLPRVINESDMRKSKQHTDNAGSDRSGAAVESRISACAPSTEPSNKSTIWLDSNTPSQNASKTEITTFTSGQVNSPVLKSCGRWDQKERVITADQSSKAISHVEDRMEHSAKSDRREDSRDQQLTSTNIKKASMDPRLQPCVQLIDCCKEVQRMQIEQRSPKKTVKTNHHKISQYCSEKRQGTCISTDIRLSTVKSAKSSPDRVERKQSLTDQNGNSISRVADLDSISDNVGAASSSSKQRGVSLEENMQDDMDSSPCIVISPDPSSDDSDGSEPEQQNPEVIDITIEQEEVDCLSKTEKIPASAKSNLEALQSIIKSDVDEAYRRVTRLNLCSSKHDADVTGTACDNRSDGKQQAQVEKELLKCKVPAVVSSTEEPDSQDGHQVRFIKPEPDDGTINDEQLITRHTPNLATVKTEHSAQVNLDALQRIMTSEVDEAYRRVNQCGTTTTDDTAHGSGMLCEMEREKQKSSVVVAESITADEESKGLKSTIMHTFEALLQNIKTQSELARRELDDNTADLATALNVADQQPPDSAEMKGEQFSDQAEIKVEQLPDRAKIKGEQFSDCAEIKGEQFSDHAEIKVEQFSDRTEMKGEQFHDSAEIKGEQFHDCKEIKGELFPDSTESKWELFPDHTEIKGEQFPDRAEITDEQHVASGNTSDGHASDTSVSHNEKLCQVTTKRFSNKKPANTRKTAIVWRVPVQGGLEDIEESNTSVPPEIDPQTAESKEHDMPSSAPLLSTDVYDDQVGEKNANVNGSLSACQAECSPISASYNQAGTTDQHLPSSTRAPLKIVTEFEPDYAGDKRNPLVSPTDYTTFFQTGGYWRAPDDPLVLAESGSPSKSGVTKQVPYSPMSPTMDDTLPSNTEHDRRNVPALHSPYKLSIRNDTYSPASPSADEASRSSSDHQTDNVDSNLSNSRQDARSPGYSSFKHLMRSQYFTPMSPTADDTSSNSNLSNNKQYSLRIPSGYSPYKALSGNEEYSPMSSTVNDVSRSSNSDLPNNKPYSLRIPSGYSPYKTLSSNEEYSPMSPTVNDSFHTGTDQQSANLNANSSNDERNTLPLRIPSGYSPYATGNVSRVLVQSRKRDDAFVGPMISDANASLSSNTHQAVHTIHPADQHLEGNDMFDETKFDTDLQTDDIDSEAKQARPHHSEDYPQKCEPHSRGMCTSYQHPGSREVDNEQTDIAEQIMSTDVEITASSNANFPSPLHAKNYLEGPSSAAPRCDTDIVNCYDVNTSSHLAQSVKQLSDESRHPDLKKPNRFYDDAEFSMCRTEDYHDENSISPFNYYKDLQSTCRNDQSAFDSLITQRSGNDTRPDVCSEYPQDRIHSSGNAQEHNDIFYNASDDDSLTDDNDSYYEPERPSSDVEDYDTDQPATSNCDDNVDEADHELELSNKIDRDMQLDPAKFDIISSMSAMFRNNPQMIAEARTLLGSQEKKMTKDLKISDIAAMNLSLDASISRLLRQIRQQTSVNKSLSSKLGFAGHMNEPDPREEIDHLLQQSAAETVEVKEDAFESLFSAYSPEKQITNQLSAEEMAAKWMGEISSVASSTSNTEVPKEDHMTNAIENVFRTVNMDMLKKVLGSDSDETTPTKRLPTEPPSAQMTNDTEHVKMSEVSTNINSTLDENGDVETNPEKVSGLEEGEAKTEDVNDDDTQALYSAYCPKKLGHSQPSAEETAAKWMRELSRVSGGSGILQLPKKEHANSFLEDVCKALNMDAIKIMLQNSSDPVCDDNDTGDASLVANVHASFLEHGLPIESPSQLILPPSPEGEKDEEKKEEKTLPKTAQKVSCADIISESVPVKISESSHTDGRTTKEAYLSPTCTSNLVIDGLASTKDDAQDTNNSNHEEKSVYSGDILNWFEDVLKPKWDRKLSDPSENDAKKPRQINRAKKNNKTQSCGVISETVDIVNHSSPDKEVIWAQDYDNTSIHEKEVMRTAADKKTRNTETTSKKQVSSKKTQKMSVDQMSYERKAVGDVTERQQRLEPSQRRPDSPERSRKTSGRTKTDKSLIVISSEDEFNSNDDNSSRNSILIKKKAASGELDQASLDFLAEERQRLLNEIVNLGNISMSDGDSSSTTPQRRTSVDSVASTPSRVESPKAVCQGKLSLAFSEALKKRSKPVVKPRLSSVCMKVVHESRRNKLSSPIRDLRSLLTRRSVLTRDESTGSEKDKRHDSSSPAKLSDSGKKEISLRDLKREKALLLKRLSVANERYRPSKKPLTNRTNHDTRLHKDETRPKSNSKQNTYSRPLKRMSAEKANLKRETSHQGKHVSRSSSLSDLKGTSHLKRPISPCETEPAIKHVKTTISSNELSLGEPSQTAHTNHGLHHVPTLGTVPLIDAEKVQTVPVLGHLVSISRQSLRHQNSNPKVAMVRPLIQPPQQNTQGRQSHSSSTKISEPKKSNVSLNENILSQHSESPISDTTAKMLAWLSSKVKQHTEACKAYQEKVESDNKRRKMKAKKTVKTTPRKAPHAFRDGKSILKSAVKIARCTPRATARESVPGKNDHSLHSLIGHGEAQVKQSDGKGHSKAIRRGVFVAQMPECTELVPDNSDIIYLEDGELESDVSDSEVDSRSTNKICLESQGTSLIESVSNSIDQQMALGEYTFNMKSVNKGNSWSTADIKQNVSAKSVTTQPTGILQAQPVHLSQTRLTDEEVIEPSGIVSAKLQDKVVQKPQSANYPKQQSANTTMPQLAAVAPSLPVSVSSTAGPKSQPAGVARVARSWSSLLSVSQFTRNVEVTKDRQKAIKKNSFTLTEPSKNNHRGQSSGNKQGAKSASISKLDDNFSTECSKLLKKIQVQTPKEEIAEVSVKKTDSFSSCSLSVWLTQFAEKDSELFKRLLFEVEKHGIQADKRYNKLSRDQRKSVRSAIERVIMNLRLSVQSTSINAKNPFRLLQLSIAKWISAYFDISPSSVLYKELLDTATSAGFSPSTVLQTMPRAKRKKLQKRLQAYVHVYQIGQQNMDSTSNQQDIDADNSEDLPLTSEESLSGLPTVSNEDILHLKDVMANVFKNESIKEALKWKLKICGCRGCAARDLRTTYRLISDKMQQLEKPIMEIKKAFDAANCGSTCPHWDIMLAIERDIKYAIEEFDLSVNLLTKTGHIMINTLSEGLERLKLICEPLRATVQSRLSVTFDFSVAAGNIFVAKKKASYVAFKANALAELLLKVLPEQNCKSCMALVQKERRESASSDHAPVKADKELSEDFTEMKNTAAHPPRNPEAEVRLLQKISEEMDQNNNTDSHGKVHCRLPAELLLPSEENQVISSEGYALYLMRPIPEKTYERVQMLTKSINYIDNEIVMNRLGSATDQLKVNNFEQERARLSERRRNFLLPCSGGYYTLKRINWIRDEQDRYEEAREILKRIRQPTADDKELLAFVEQQMSDIKIHLGICLDEKYKAEYPSVSSYSDMDCAKRENKPVAEVDIDWDMIESREDNAGVVNKRDNTEFYEELQIGVKRARMQQQRSSYEKVRSQFISTQTHLINVSNASDSQWFRDNRHADQKTVQMLGKDGRNAPRHRQPFMRDSSWEDSRSVHVNSSDVLSGAQFAVSNPTLRDVRELASSYMLNDKAFDVEGSFSPCVDDEDDDELPLGYEERVMNKQTNTVSLLEGIADDQQQIVMVHKDRFPDDRPHRAVVAGSGELRKPLLQESGFEPDEDYHEVRTIDVSSSSDELHTEQSESPKQIQRWVSSRSRSRTPSPQRRTMLQSPQRRIHARTRKQNSSEVIPNLMSMTMGQKHNTEHVDSSECVLGDNRYADADDKAQGRFRSQPGHQRWHASRDSTGSQVDQSGNRSHHSNQGSDALCNQSRYAYMSNERSLRMIQRSSHQQVLIPVPSAPIGNFQNNPVPWLANEQMPVIFPDVRQLTVEMLLEQEKLILREHLHQSVMNVPGMLRQEFATHPRQHYRPYHGGRGPAPNSGWI